MRFLTPLRAFARAFAVAVAWLSAIASARAEDVPYLPTPPEVVVTMMKAGSVGPGDTVIDLGSGDGRIPITAVKDFGARRALGVDINARLVREAQAAARSAGVSDRVEFREGDLFGYDFSSATVLTMYLLPELNLRLRPKILAMKPGMLMLTGQPSTQAGSGHIRQRSASCSASAAL